MNERQLADRIGNVNDHLVQQAGSPHNRRGGGMLRRIAALAACAALAVCSFTVGAWAFPREVEKIVEVEVPAHQETIELPELGLTLILPDSWKGKYVAQFDRDGGGVSVYVKSIYNSTGSLKGAGCLFYIITTPEVWTASQFDELSPVPGKYLFATEKWTCALYYASDVQYDPSDPEQVEEYTAMGQEARNIRIVMEDLFAE